MPVIRDGVPYLTDDEFWAAFEPVQDGDDGLKEFSQTDIDDCYAVHPNHIWTMTQSHDTGNLYIQPGYHYVNREHYVLTKRPWNDQTLDVLWWDEEAWDKECLEHERLNNLH